MTQREKLIAAARRAVTPNDYSMVVEPLSSEDGGGFAAHVPDLPGCMSRRHPG